MTRPGSGLPARIPVALLERPETAAGVRASVQSLGPRFWPRVTPAGDPTDPDTCWIWQGATAAGRPYFWINPRPWEGVRMGGRPFAAVRVAAELLGVGDTSGLQFWRRCASPLCVRPSHYDTHAIQTVLAGASTRGQGAEAYLATGERRKSKRDALAAAQAHSGGDAIPPPPPPDAAPLPSAEARAALRRPPPLIAPESPIPPASAVASALARPRPLDHATTRRPPSAAYVDPRRRFADAA